MLQIWTRDRRHLLPADQRVDHLLLGSRLCLDLSPGVPPLTARCGEHLQHEVGLRVAPHHRTNLVAVRWALRPIDHAPQQRRELFIHPEDLATHCRRPPLLGLPTRGAQLVCMAHGQRLE
eukprot:6133684-Prymnesium_polylepis.5